MKLFLPPIAACAVVVSAFASELPITRGDPVIVTATRFAEHAQHSPIGVEVITAEDIRRSTASTLPELLSQRSGIRT
ncbi:MAG: hypothetical protein ACXWUB_05360, partial [Burkholderiales bacterium]